MDKHVCVQCQTSFMNVENGVFVFEMYEHGIYKIWKADLKRCKCGNDILASFSRIPYAEHFDEGFEELVETIRESQKNVYEWKEK